MVEQNFGFHDRQQVSCISNSVTLTYSYELYTVFEHSFC
jgi:hypothetical protein